MPPKIKISRENIINTALDVVRKNGENAINARTIAEALKCSTQPIFSNFSTMEELRFEVIAKATEICEEYIKTEVESQKYPIYKASGMAYIRFAKEESELFKLLYMRNRKGEDLSQGAELFKRMEVIVQSNTGLNQKNSELFHLEMWAYVHGIATMLATGFLNLETELISRMLSDAYLGMRKQYEVE